MPAGDKPYSQGLSGKDRQVRVFISSTFRDMHAERDHLVTVVFPELRERVEQLGLEFFDVDLRWGVPAKTLDGETANSWEYCRQWIDRVEPFFVCILGQRYGWVPKVEDFKSDVEKARQAAEPRSITDLEVRHAVLNDRRKRRSYFYLRETLVPELPPNATAEERKLYAEFVDPEPEAGKLTALKNDVKQCKRPARGYQCRWTGKEFADLDKAEKKFGPMVLEDLWSGVLRDERYVSKDVWRQVLGGDPDSDPRYTDESEPVPRELWEKIVALARPAPVSPLDAERQQMDAFAASRLRWFQGRTCELQQLTDFIQSTAADAPHLAVVAAVPGQGKSALLAKLWQDFTQATLTQSDGHPLPSDGRGAGGEGHFVIIHFVGATERSATAHALAERLLGELDRSRIQWPPDEQKEGEKPKRDFNSLCERLRKRLGDYAGESRVVILLDALNQLTDGHDLHWLPVRLGPSVRVVVSCVEDATAKADSPEQRVLHALVSRQPAPLRVPLGPLAEDDVRTIVVEYLKEYCHELDREHLDTLCAIPQARNPLYLLVMLNELRTLGGNDLSRIVPAMIAAMPQEHPDTVSLFRWVLQRLEVFGAEAVRWWCLYLAHGRVGMASHELADLLGHKLGADAAATALLIERGLRRYLLRRGSQLDFFHGQLRQAVMEEYGSQAEEIGAHSDIATYFHDQADPERNQTWKCDSSRPFLQLVFHLAGAQRLDELCQTLCDLRFVEARCEGRQIFSLIADYRLAQESVTEATASHLLQQFQSCVWAAAALIARFPFLVFQELSNRLRWLDDCAPSLRASLDREILRRRQAGNRLLTQRLPYQESSARTQMATTPTEQVIAVAATGEGFILWYGGGVWKELAESGYERVQGTIPDLRYSQIVASDRVFVAASGRTLLLWFNGLAARPQTKTCSFPVGVLSLSITGRELLVAGQKGEWFYSRLNDTEYEIIGSGNCDTPITASAIASAGQFCVLGTATGQIIVAANSVEEISLRHEGKVAALATHPYSPLVASGGQDGVVQVFTEKGECLGQWQFNSWINDLAFAADGKSLFVGSESGALDWIILEPLGAEPITWTTESIPLIKLAVNQHSDVVAVLGQDQAVRLIKAPPRTRGAFFELPLSGDVKLIAPLAGNDSVLLVADGDGQRCIIDMGKLPPTVSRLDPCVGAVLVALPLGQSAYIAVHGGFGQGCIVVHKWQDGGFSAQEVWPSSPFEKWRTIADAALSPDQTRLVLNLRKTGSVGSYLRVLDTKTWQEITTYDAGDKEITTIVASDNAEHILAGSHKRLLPPQLINRCKQAQELPINGNPMHVPTGCRELAIDATGKRLAAIDYDGRAWLCVSGDRTSNSFSLLNEGKAVCMMSADGCWLLQASYDGVFELLDISGDSSKRAVRRRWIGAVPWQITNGWLDAKAGRVYLGGSRSCQVFEWDERTM